MSRTILINSLTYGFARISSSAVYLLVAVWYGISAETDSFFLTYTVVVFLVTALSSTLSRYMIPNLKNLSSPFFLITILLPGLVVALLSFLVSSSLLLVFSLYAGLRVGASLLDGHLTARGHFTKPPLAIFLAGGVTVLIAWFLKVDLGIKGIAWALAAGELWRLAFLLTFASFSPTSMSFLVKKTSYLTLSAMAFGAAPLVTRVIASFASEGYVSILTYAGGVLGVFTALLTTGLIVTKGRDWKDVAVTQIQLEFKLIAQSGFRKLSKVALPIGVGLVVLGLTLNWSLVQVIGILLAGLPVYFVAGVALPALVALNRIHYLLFTSLVNVICLVFVGLLVFSPWGVVAVALGITGAEIILAKLMKKGVENAVLA